MLASGWFLLGQELDEFERALAGDIGVKHCVGCASGTEAIALALMAVDVGPNHEVITVAHILQFRLSRLFQWLVLVLSLWTSDRIPA